MCHCIMWNCLSIDIESKSLWYDGVTRYQWHSIVQMVSGKRAVITIVVWCIYRWPKPSPPATGVGCYVYIGGAWVNSLSYVVDMVLLAPSVTALQTLLEVCRAYPGPHDIAYNTTKTECMLVQPTQSQGRYSTTVRLGNEELSFVVEFRYQGHVMTADCRDDKDIIK